MVRMIPVSGKNGQTVWVEDRPDVCPAGHEDRLLPSWGGCPVCGEPVRLWKCTADGCVGLLYDDEHVHYGRRGRPTSTR